MNWIENDSNGVAWSTLRIFFVVRSARVSSVNGLYATSTCQRKLTENVVLLRQLRFACSITVQARNAEVVDTHESLARNGLLGLVRRAKVFKLHFIVSCLDHATFDKSGMSADSRSYIDYT